MNKQENSLKIVEGTFDGENMWGQDNKIYPVAPNYASKSKLVEGDVLKLYIQPDGKFIFKQIGPVERRNVIGKITEGLCVEAGGGKYKILHNSLTYFKAEPGDEAFIILPAYGKPVWAALENVIKPVNKDKIDINISY